ncbi:lytic transglycosylase domain-containing protein [Jannaschia sp. LMIT008]|uniref:lytic transglycosylase domain-containing protein n=1 Tax=Jannaschia maritima TaxID=3032585 RepID=UPI00281188C6|nr:lytic transglycosylase domain-containing protein [Jannaschia sp. LMIT008]
MSVLRRLGLAAAVALLSWPAAAETEFELGLDRFRAQQYDATRAARSRVDDPVLRDVLDWHLLRAREGTFAEAAAFIERNPDWPGLPLLRAQAERMMPAALPPERVVAFLGGEPPRTAEGALRLAIALRALDRIGAAEAASIDAWLEKPMTAAAQAGFLAVFGDLLAPFHPARLDAMVWDGHTESAERMLDLVGGPEAALARARIALREERAGVDTLIEALPDGWADHHSLAYERFSWRLGKGRRDSALEMLFANDAGADALGDPPAWAAHRLRLARGLMQDGRLADAYRVAANNHLPPGHRLAGQIEWLAGYIALRFRDDPGAAAEHFRRMDAAVASPISKGRAGYWLGRALQEAGDAAGARAAYAAGGRYQTSFYGQLAAERAGLPPDPNLAGDEVFPALADTPLARSTVLDAARKLAALGERSLAERFAAHMAETLDRPLIGTLIDEILRWDEPHIALMTAKRAARRGLELHRGYYPVTDLATLPSPVAPELSLSIARRESEFDPVVVSHAGARGLMQVMPGTARAVAGDLGLPYSAPRLTADPLYNARLGTAYLAELEGEFGRSPILVPAAYNAGPSRAHRWTARLGRVSDPSVDLVDWIEDVPFAETRNYIMRVSESLLPYAAQLRGLPEEMPLSRWLRDGYGADLPAATATKATRN